MTHARAWQDPEVLERRRQEERDALYRIRTETSLTIAATTLTAMGKPLAAELLYSGDMNFAEYSKLRQEAKSQHARDNGAHTPRPPRSCPSQAHAAVCVRASFSYPRTRGPGRG